MRGMSRYFSAWLLLGLLPGILPAATLMLPGMPEPQLAPSVSSGVGLSRAVISGQLAAVLPAENSRLNVGLAASADRNPGQPGEAAQLPVPARVEAESLTAIHFSDNLYAPLDHAYIPVLLDWFDALLLDLQLTPAEARARGLLTNKVARLMHVFVSARLTRHGPRSLAMSPAIGWCRVYFREDWGRCLRGETHSLILLATDKGWFALDPYARRLRHLTAGDERWVVELIVL